MIFNLQYSNVLAIELLSRFLISEFLSFLTYSQEM